MNMALFIKSNLAVLKQLSAHCFVYRCQIWFKPCNRCSCYCGTCRIYLSFCQQIYYDQDSVYEDELNDIIPNQWLYTNIYVMSVGNSVEARNSLHLHLPTSSFNARPSRKFSGDEAPNHPSLQVSACAEDHPARHPAGGHYTAAR